MMENATQARRAVRQSLLDNGVPASAVDEVTDLAFHAAESAANTFKDTIFRGSDARIMITAIGVGTGVLTALIDEMTKATHRIAGDHDLPVKMVEVRCAQ